MLGTPMACTLCLPACQEGEDRVSHGDPCRCGRHHQLKMPHIRQNVQLYLVILGSDRDILLHIVQRHMLIVAAYNVPLRHP